MLPGFCAGAVVGLVTITPGSGYLRPHFAIVVGILGKFDDCYFIQNELFML